MARRPHSSEERSSGRRVLVTDASRGSAVAIIRSLGRRGFHVIAADSQARSAGFYSRYAQDRLRYPPPDEAPDETIATLLRAARERRVDLIVPVTDQILLPLSQARERFEGVSAVALPEPEALARTTDKLATLELARELGIPTPQTRLVESVGEALAALPKLGWPVVLKPQMSSAYRAGQAVEAYEVGYAESRDALIEQMRRFEGRCRVLLQEYYRGEGHGVELLTYRGRPLAAFQHRRLREVPITGGASSFRESVPLDPILYDSAVRLLEALAWTGLAMVEFKLGTDGPKLMEVNGRVWGSLPLAVKSGVDFPARAAELYLSGPPNGGRAPDTAYAVGVRSRNLDLEMLWIGSVLRRRRRYPFLPAPSRRQAVAAALRLAYPGDGFDILSREDPRPGLAELADIARKLRRKVGNGV